MNRKAALATFKKIYSTLITVVVVEFVASETSAEEAKGISRPYATVSAAIEYLSDTTVLTLDEYHGSQIEYLAADGTTSLWYPGNSGPVLGQWKVIEDEAKHPLMCFLYGSNTYNL